MGILLLPSTLKVVLAKRRARSISPLWLRLYQSERAALFT